MPDEVTPDESAERTVKQYIANAAGEGAMAAARRLSDAIGVSLAEVLRAVQEAGTGTVTIAGLGSIGSILTVMPPAGTVVVSDADTGAATDRVEVIRQVDVDELSAQPGRPSPAAALPVNQLILIAIVMIAAVFPVLPPDVQKALMDDATLTAALAAVLGLLKR